MIFYMENETNNEINETSEDLENSAEMFPKGVCEVGSVVDGVVSGIAKFGAFVDLPDGRRGLVHISQISEGFVKEVRDCLEVGQKVKVYIMSCEGEKIRLSIKEASKKLGIQQVSDKSLGDVSAGTKSFEKDKKLNYMIDKFMKDSDNSASTLANRLDRRR